MKREIAIGMIGGAIAGAAVAVIVAKSLASAAPAATVNAWWCSTDDSGLCDRTEGGCMRTDGKPCVAVDFAYCYFDQIFVMGMCARTLDSCDRFAHLIKDKRGEPERGGNVCWGVR
jgi:hypothetical protein